MLKYSEVNIKLKFRRRQKELDWLAEYVSDAGSTVFIVNFKQV